MVLLNKFREELQKERYQQQAYVHSVNVGIGCDYDIVVTQVLHLLLNVKCRLKKIKLLILVHYFLAHPIRIERLTTKAEYRLGIYIPRFGNGTRSRVTFGNKQ